MSEPEPSTDAPPVIGWKTHVWVFAIIIPWVAAIFGILIASVLYAPSPYYLLAVVPSTFLIWIVLRESVVETLVVAIILATLLFFARSAVDRLHNAHKKRSARSHNMVFTQSRSFVVGEAFGGQASITSVASFGWSRRDHLRSLATGDGVGTISLTQSHSLRSRR